MRFPGLLILVLILIITAVRPDVSEAQALRLFAGNTLFGAATGAAVGGASMALANDTDLRPLRMGVGFGTIGGFGVGAYDAATLSPGMQVNGLIHSAPMTGTIILMDTIYGAATGSMLGMAVSLIGDTRVVKGLQYGAGVGAYAGLAFGFLDGFYFSSSGSGEFFDYSSHQNGQPNEGLIAITAGENRSFSTFGPTVYQQNALTPSGGSVITHQSFGVEFFRFNSRF